MHNGAESVVYSNTPVCSSCPKNRDSTTYHLLPTIYQKGFTIVELLVVIVVIGILAAITIVSYAGINQRASVASVKSDLTNSANILKMDQVVGNGYPAAMGDINSGKGLIASLGNNFTDYQVDSTVTPQAFCLTVTNSSNISYRITNDSVATLGNCSRVSCLAILNASESTGSGFYWIKPSTTAYQVYCDMDNGGWTRLNNNISTSSTAFNGSDLLLVNNVNGACGSPGCAFTINNISVVHTNVKILLTRTTSIIQCPSLLGVGGGGSSSYWNGSGWTSYGMCNWSDGIFANAIATNMTGLKMLWKLEGTKATNGEIKFQSMCSDNSDRGQMQITTWVK